MIKVEPLQDNTYQVVEYVIDCTASGFIYDYRGFSYSYKDVLFQGSLSDCEAYIRLKEGGYL